MDDWRRTCGDKMPDAVKEFLEYRHREWELEIEADLQSCQAGRASKRANRDSWLLFGTRGGTSLDI
jgi:hypothetical protein